jgi:Lar family restriction alleviation protein
MKAPFHCPFCGCRGRHLTNEGKLLSGGTDLPHVICLNCHARGPEIIPGEDMDGNRTKRDALRAWNTRA